MNPVSEPKSDPERISTTFGALFFLQSGGRPYDFLWNLKLLPLFPWQFCYSEMLCKASECSLGWKLSGRQQKPSQSQNSMEILGSASGPTGLEGDPWRLWQESCSKQKCFLTSWKYCVGCWLPIRAGRFLGMLKWFTSSAILALDQAMLYTSLLMEGQNLTYTACWVFKKGCITEVRHWWPSDFQAMKRNWSSRWRPGEALWLQWLCRIERWDRHIQTCRSTWKNSHGAKGSGLHGSCLINEEFTGI